MKKIFIAIFMLGIIFQQSVSQAQSCGTSQCQSPLPPKPPVPIDPVKVFDRNICQGSPYTLQDALRYMKPAQTFANVADLNGYSRIRNCNQFSGCDGWSMSSGIGLNIGGFTFNRVDKIDLNVQLRTGTLNNIDFTITRTLTNADVFASINYQPTGLATFTQTYDDPEFLFDKDSRFPFSMGGFISNNCAWFGKELKSKVDSSGSWKEYQAVLYSPLK